MSRAAKNHQHDEMQAQAARAVRRDSLRLHIFNTIVSIVLVAALLVVFVPIRKAKANPAIVVPGVVAACEAAGISIDTWALVMTAIITGTTGVSLIGAAYDYQTNIAIPRDQRHWKTPGWPDWDSLTPEEKQQSGCNSNYEYYLQWLEAYALVYGMYTPGNGSNDPDDPEGPKFSSDLVSQIAAISTGGVALASYRYPTDKGNYLFDTDNGLGLLYANNLVIDEKPCMTAIVDDSRVPNDKPFIIRRGTPSATQTWKYVFWQYSYTGGNKDTYQTIPITLNYVDGKWKIVNTPTLTNGYRSDQTYIGQNNYNTYYLSNPQIYEVYGIGYGGKPEAFIALNSLYSNTYTFITDEGSATFQNNQLVSTDLDVSNQIDYGQIQNTPVALEQAVPSMQSLNDYFANVDNGLPVGQSTYIVAPNINYINEPTYDDFVQVKNDSGVNPDPEPDPDPDPDPDPNPNPEEDLDENLAERFSRIIAQPFKAAFPFCLIEDARSLFLKLDAQAIRPDFTVRIPLHDFNVDNVEEIEIDASVLEDLGTYVKVFFNIAWTAALIAFAYKLFLKRGE